MVLDSFSIDILTSLITNGCTILMNYVSKRAIKIIECKSAIQKDLKANTALVSNIREVMVKIAKNPIILSDKSNATRLQQFLQSPTTESIIRQIYSDFFPKEIQEKSTEQLQKEFQISLAYHLGVNANNVTQIARDLFRVISMGCCQALDFTIEKGILSAHEAKSIARHRIILDELNAIKSNLDFLVNHSELDLNAIEVFEKQYRQQIGGRYSQITIPHFDRAPRIDINKIFISPSFLYTSKKKGTEPETISMDRFLTKLYRIVLLGDPGGGKSTLSEKICYDLCKKYKKRILCNRLLTPVLVVLREYSTKKKQEDVSIIQFMESEVTSKYQLPKEAPPDAFEYLLSNGHLFVIFDGLDELLDPSYRREISADIESFCDLFPSVPVLVTSRIVGYEQAPLSSNRFETFCIEPFDDAQVSEYAKKWFANDPTDPNLSIDESRQHTETFLKESLIVSDLRSNPLMLALMCNLYRGAGYIPRNRPEVYKKCSEMLLERWDPSRGIWVNLPIPEPKFLLSHLAHWIYSDESLQSGVPENTLNKEAAKFLLSRRFETEEEAEKAAKEFIEFCRGRAWVFTDVGTTAEGVSLYKFTHKTFLEYFTAANIVRNNNTPEKLWDLLNPKIKRRAWDVVTQLAFQMLHEQVEGASDKLLSFLIRDAQKKKTTQWSYLSFGARSLQFIYPSPKIIRRLTKLIVSFVIKTNTINYYKEYKNHFFPRNVNKELMYGLLFAPFEYSTIIADSLQNEIIKYANKKSDSIAYRAIDMGLTLYRFVVGRFAHEYYEYTTKQDVFKYWKEVSNKIFEQVNVRLESFIHRNFSAFMYWFNHHDEPIEKLFEWYTPAHLFIEPYSIVFGNIFIPSIAMRYIDTFHLYNVKVKEQTLKELKIMEKIMSKVGKILLDKPLPCFSLPAGRLEKDRLFFLSPFFWDSYFHRRVPKFKKLPMRVVDNKSIVCLSNDAIIGTWCLLAIIAEVQGKEEKLVRFLKRFNNPIFDAISDVIETRIYGSTSNKALEKLEKLNLPKTAVEFIEKWIKGQISFVRKHEQKK